MYIILYMLYEYRRSAKRTWLTASSPPMFLRVKSALKRSFIGRSGSLSTRPTAAVATVASFPGRATILGFCKKFQRTRFWFVSLPFTLCLQRLRRDSATATRRTRRWLNKTRAIWHFLRGSADGADFGEESVASPVCYETNTKANQDPKYQTWISIHKSLLIFLDQSFVACKTNRTNNTFAASWPLVWLTPN